MKSPKGFGKNYFSFASVLAYSVQNKIQNLIIKVDYLLQHNAQAKQDEIEEDDPPNDLLLASLILKSSKYCHCNYFYKLKSILLIKINTYFARCPYYTTYFAFRRTGVHPPLLSFN